MIGIPNRIHRFKADRGDIQNNQLAQKAVDHAAFSVSLASSFENLKHARLRNHLTVTLKTLSSVNESIRGKRFCFNPKKIVAPYPYFQHSV